MTSALTLLLTLSAPSAALDVFVLDDGGSGTDDLVSELESWGHTVTVSSTSPDILEYEFTGAEAGLDITTYDAVIWLDGGNSMYSEMTTSGLDTLTSFVDGGGGLLLFGATGYQYDELGYYDGYGDLIPLRNDESSIGSSTWTVVSGTHPLAEGYSTGDTFTLNSALLKDSSASSGTMVFSFVRGSSTYAGGSAVELGDGRLVQYALWGNLPSITSVLGTDWTDGDVSQLVENALQWIVQRPPDVVMSSSFTVAAESSVTMAPSSASDPDGGPVTYAWDIGSDGSVEGTGDSYTFTAAGYDGPTTQGLTLTVTDDEGVSTAVTATITINNVAPAISGTSSSGTVAEGTSATLSVSYSDVESADTQTVSWDFGDGTTGTGDSVSHAWGDNDDYTVIVTVTDDDGGLDSSSFTQTTTNVAPTLSGDPDTTATQGVSYSFTPTVTDPGTDDTFSFTASLPDGASVDGSTGQVTWTPTTDQLGTYGLTLTVQDDDGGEDSLSWDVDVSFVDTDGDGMSDTWESTYGLDPSDPSDATADGDGDGRTNLEEFLDGTDPTVYDGPGQPTLVSPADDAEVSDISPTFQVDNATAPLDQTISYGFQVYEDEDLTLLYASVDSQVEGTDGTTQWQLDSPELVENTDYWWTANAADDYITGESASPAFHFFFNTVNEAPSAPGIYSPFDGGIVATLTPDMVLTASEDPDRDALTYRAVIENLDGELITQVDGLTDDGSTATWSLTTDLVDDTDYCWYAVAVDPDGLESDASEYACFFVNLSNEAPSAPIIIDPTDNSTVGTLLPTITVTNGVDPEGRATIHEFQLDLLDTFDSESLQAGSVDTDTSVDGDGQTSWTADLKLSEDTVWYARARCNDGGEASDWSTVSFLVSLSDGAPTTPALVSPADGLELGEAPSFVVDNATDPEGTALSYDFVVTDRLGDTVASAEGLAEGAGGQTQWAPDTLADGVYSWTSRAVDAGDQASDWALTWSFAVSDGVVTGTGGGADDSGLGDGSGLAPLDIKGEGCACSSTAPPGGASLAIFGGLLGLLGLRRRERFE
ncbi:MAG: PKD domain-containing protein [Oligoflexia bacterium]|nr:PKD domain-containing protein [Oligoflexia bacterium]